MILLLLASLLHAQSLQQRVDAHEIRQKNLESGRPTITGLPTFQNGIKFGDGTTQTTAAVGTSTGAYIVLKGTRTSGVDEGAITAGAWANRRLNWEETDTGSNVVVSTNEWHATFQPGTYRCRWSAPCFACDQNSTRLYDYTNNALVAAGSSEFVSRTNLRAQARSVGEVRFTLSAVTTLVLQHQTDFTTGGNGLGVNSNNGQPEVYSMLACEKE